MNASNVDLLLGAAFNAAVYPFEYVQRLIQMGAEPELPRWRVSWSGKPYLALPSTLEYLQFIVAYDGLLGCYRGCVPWFAWHYLHKITYERMILWGASRRKAEAEADEGGGSERRDAFIRDMLWDLCSTWTATAAAYPLRLVTLRCMAQFVGRETTYSSLTSSISDVARKHPFRGFYAGLVPCLLGDALAVLLSHTLKFMLDTLAGSKPGKKEKLSALLANALLRSYVCYPFEVVATNMAVVDSGLAIGRPPYMPLYPHWTGCFEHLRQTNQLRRGASFFPRAHTWPNRRLEEVASGSSQYHALHLLRSL